MPPLATHTERLFQVIRTFDLYADRIEVIAVWRFGKTHRSTVRLADLTPDAKPLIIRNKYAKRFRWMLAGGMILASWPIYRHTPNSALLYLGILFMLGGALGIATTLRKIQFIRFPRKDGTPGLDIARPRKSTVRFEAFLKSLQSRIRKA